MKRIIIVLLLSSASALADWTRVDGNDDQDTYVDPATIHRQANTVDLWALLDYKTSHQWSDYLLYWSLKAEKEFDCDAGQYRTLETLLHFEHMGNGQSVYTVPGGTLWQPVPADSLDAVLWKVACKP